MANRIDNALDGIEAKLNTDLVKADGTGVLKAVVRRVINPLTETKVAIFGIIPSRGRRTGSGNNFENWEISLLGMLCTRGKGSKCDQTITELVGEIMSSFKAWNDSDAPGGVIDVPVWDFWYARGEALVPVGAVLAIRLQLSGEIKVSP